MRRSPNSGVSRIAIGARAADMRDDYDGRDVPTLESLLAVSSGTSPDELPLPEPPVPVELAEYEPVMQRMTGADTERGQRITPAHGGSQSGRRHVRGAVRRRAGRSRRAGRAVSGATRRRRLPQLCTDGLVDEVTRRVVERLAPDAANELVAQIVSEVAERLIREEISRIKAAAARS